MILRIDPVTATWLLITVLTLAFSGELFTVFLTQHERDCHQRNVVLLSEQKQGPIQECE
jgi:hypothetical protein